MHRLAGRHRDWENWTVFEQQQEKGKLPEYAGECWLVV